MVGCESHYIHDCVSYPKPVLTTWPTVNASGVEVELDCKTGFLE